MLVVNEDAQNSEQASKGSQSCSNRVEISEGF